MHIQSSPLSIIAAALLGAWLSACAPDEPYDLLIVGGLVVDGSGAPPVLEDVAVRGDRVAARGRLAGARAQRVIDASGRIVSPGFIDMLGQSSLDLLVDPSAESKLRQGITSEITGEGRSPAPQSEATRKAFAGFERDSGVRVDWSDFAGYFSRLEERGIAINLGSYVGATQVRKLVLGSERRAPASGELARMRGLVDVAMQQGALGLSSALAYAPASYARTDELVALARAAAAHGGLYATHLRSEGPRIFEALDEAFAIARQADIAVEIFHLKVAGPSMRGRMGEVLARIEEARAEGLDVAANQYPYRAGQTALSATIPPWAHEGGSEALLRRLASPSTRRRLRREIESPGADWENFYWLAGGAEGVLISSVSRRSLARYEGLRLSEVARQWRREPIRALFELLVADRANTSALFFLTSEDDVDQALVRPWISIATDSTARGRTGRGTSKPHPRAYGTFPRVLRRYVFERELLRLEEAIRKLTSLPAERLRLRDRGQLAAGYFADIVVFDRERMRDLATYDEPELYSEGVDYVVVNGDLVIDAGRLTGARPGQVLRGPGWSPEQTEAAAALSEPVCGNEAIELEPGILVFSPHPGDEVLAFSGPIYAAARAGAPLEVVVVTDGQTDCAACAVWKHGGLPGTPESGESCTPRELRVFGHVRRRESLRSLEILGVERRDVRFLGYVAGSLRRAWSDRSRAPDIPDCAAGGALPEEWRDRNGESLSRELDAIVRAGTSTSTVLTTHPFDGDADHSALYEFVREAVARAESSRPVYSAILRNNADRPCAYPNPPSERCAAPSLPELVASPDLLSARREQRYRPEGWWRPASDVDYGTPEHFCLAPELWSGETLKRRAIEAHETRIGVRDRRGRLLAAEYQGWLDASGWLLSFVHRNEPLYAPPEGQPR
jgi:dihydroorotase/N-acyl-D-amino-acid deacylase